jgi:ketosteroid isomerase-like protein
MSESQGRAIVRQWYDTLDRSLMASDVVWEIAKGFPHGGVYRGHEGVFDDFLARLKADFSDWAVTIAEIIDAGDVVIGLGSYQAQARATGIRVNVPFAHIWTIQNGKVVSLRQYADTLLLHQALTGSTDKLLQIVGKGIGIE